MRKCYNITLRESTHTAVIPATGSRLRAIDDDAPPPPSSRPCAGTQCERACAHRYAVCSRLGNVVDAFLQNPRQGLLVPAPYAQLRARPARRGWLTAIHTL